MEENKKAVDLSDLEGTYSIEDAKEVSKEMGSRIEDAKYYVPSIEEFHVGFEYEFRTLKAWEKKEVDWNDFPSYAGDYIGEAISEAEGIRVKYLDSEDIKSLGFDQITDDCFNLTLKTYRGRVNPELRILLRETVLMYFAIDPDLGEEESFVLFTGTLKNKSELVSQLERCGVALK
jgi:hypothetical protein